MSTDKYIKPETLEPFSADELINMYNKCLTGIPCEYCPLNDISFGDRVECRDHLFEFIGNHIQELNTQNKTLKESLNEQALRDIKTFNEAICDLKLELTIAIDEMFKKKENEIWNSYSRNNSISNRKSL